MEEKETKMTVRDENWDKKLNKHAMHLIRLYFMCNEILEDEDLHTYRKDEHDLLMDIRNGKYRTEKGAFNEDFYNLLHDLEKESELLFKNTSLPRECNREEIYNKILLPIYKAVLFK